MHSARRAIRTSSSISWVTLALLLQGSVDADGGDRVTSPDRLPAGLRVTRIVLPDGEAAHATPMTNPGRGAPPMQATPTPGASVAMHRPRTASNTRVSRGLALPGITNNTRGTFASINGRLERGAHLTRDGRFVVFASGATNLVLNDTNGQTDIFRLELATGTILQVDTFSETNAPVRAQYGGDYNNSMCPAASSDGRFISFYSDKKLAADDLDPLTDCYLKDMSTGTCTRLSGGIPHPAIGLNPCIGGTIRFSYLVDRWGLDISNDGHRVIFLFPDATLCDAFQNGLVHSQGWLYAWESNPSAGTRSVFTRRSPDHQPPEYQTSNISDLHLSGDGGLIAFWSDDDMGVTGTTTYNMLGLRLDSSGGYTPGAFYPLNTADGAIPKPGGSTTLYPAGATAGPTSVSDDGSLFGYMSNVGSPVTGRAFYLKNLLATATHGMAPGQALQLTGITPVSLPGTNAALPGIAAVRYPGQNMVSPSGDQFYVTSSSDYSNTPFPDELPNQGSFAEGTSYERLAIHEIAAPYASGASGNPPTYFGASRQLANYPAGVVPPVHAAQFHPSLDAAGHKMLFTAADNGITKPGGSAANFTLFLTDLDTRSFAPLLSPPTIDGQTNDHSEGSAISADGEWVVYTTFATNIEPGDDNRHADVVLYAMTAGTSSIISKGPGGVRANAPCNTVADSDRAFVNGSGPDTAVVVQGPQVPVVDKSSINNDGSIVAYTSMATNLTTDTIPVVGGLATRQVFVYRRLSGQTELVSKNGAGEVANDFNYLPSLSPDGKYVAWITRASNLGYSEPAGVQQVVVKEITTPGGRGAVQLVSKSSLLPNTGGSMNSYTCMMGGGVGNYRVVFDSSAMDLTPITNATNDGGTEVFLYDLATATLTCASLKSDGVPYKSPAYQPGVGPTWSSLNPAISRNGQYVVFASDAPLIAWDPTPSDPDTTGTIAPRSLYRYNTSIGPSGLLQVNVDRHGVEVSQFVDDGLPCHDMGVLGTAAVSDDGDRIYFLTEQPLDPFDTNQAVDLYIRDYGYNTSRRIALDVTQSPPLSLGGRFEFDAGGVTNKPIRLDDPTITSHVGGRRRVCFSSDYPDLVSGDTNGHYDIFVTELDDVQPPTPTIYPSCTPVVCTALITAQESSLEVGQGQDLVVHYGWSCPCASERCFAGCYIDSFVLTYPDQLLLSLDGYPSGIDLNAVFPGSLSFRAIAQGSGMIAVHAGWSGGSGQSNPTTSVSVGPPVTPTPSPVPTATPIPTPLPTPGPPNGWVLGQ